MVQVETVIEQLRRFGGLASVALEQLAACSGTERTDIDGSGGILFLDRFWDWLPLEAEGHLAQRQAKESYDKFANLARALLSGSVTPKLADFDRAESDIRRLIDQDPDRVGELDEVRADALAGVARQISLIESLFGPSSALVVVPDTSAVLDVPNLEAFDYGEQEVEVTITPVLLRELNEIKDDGRKDREVRERARSVIKQLRDYRSRGNIIRGVDGYQGVRIRGVPTEPRMSESLGWLDPDVNDDRLIASVLEVMRQNLGSRVVLVTSDLNQQNKADAAGIVYVEPPTLKP